MRRERERQWERFWSEGLLGGQIEGINVCLGLLFVCIMFLTFRAQKETINLNFLVSCRRILIKICQNEAPAIPYLSTRVLPGKSNIERKNQNNARRNFEKKSNNPKSSVFRVDVYNLFQFLTLLWVSYKEGVDQVPTEKRKLSEQKTLTEGGLVIHVRTHVCVVGGAPRSPRFARLARRPFALWR